MKKLLLAVGLMFFVPTMQASDSDLYDIYFSSIGIATVNGPVPGATILFDAPPKGNQTCLTKLTWQAVGFVPAGLTFTILSGNATAYQVTATTFTVPFQDYWDYQNALCLQPSVTTYFNVDSSSTYKIHAVGYGRSRRE